MKKFLVLLSVCALCLAIGFAGCTSGENGENGESGQGNGHVHDYGELIPEKPATCTEGGFAAYYYCEGCGKYFDSEKHEKTFAELRIDIDPNAHKWGEWTESEATCERQGGETRVCTLNNSHIEIKNPVPAIGHILEENQLVCKTCSRQLADSLNFELNSDNTYKLTLGTPASGGKIMIPKIYNGLPVTSIGQQAVCFCDDLTSIFIPDSVTSIGIGAFTTCANLTSVTIGNGVTEIGYMAFSRCTSLKSVTIPDSVTSIGLCAFIHCDSLASVTIGNGVTSISREAFGDCALTSIFIPDSVTSIGKEAFNSLGFENFTVSDNNTTYSSQDGILYNKEKTELISVPRAKLNVTIPAGVTSIGKEAFYDCFHLTSITIPAGITSIDEDAFGFCMKLVEVINLSDLPIKQGEDTYGDVAYHALNVINSPEQSKIKYLQDYIFYEDGDTVYLLGYKGTNTELQLPEKFGEKTYKIYDYAFQCIKITEVTIPDGVTSIGKSAFTSCTNLKSITIGNGVTFIGNYAFSGCTAEIKWGDNPSIKKIDDSSFYMFKGTSITIPNGVTYIGKNAFGYCENLTSITIPDSVTYIGSGAFDYCYELTSVEFENPDGWYYTSSDSETSGTDIAGEDLQNIETAATYLTDAYKDYYWRRKTA